jgi:hypothetical protein
MSRNLRQGLPVWIRNAFSRCLSVLSRRGRSEPFGTPAPEVAALLSAGVWCGCALRGCPSAKRGGPSMRLAGARPPLKLWECSRAGDCRYKVPAGVVWALWSAARGADGSAESLTLKSGTPTTSRACGPQSAEEAGNGNVR